jgi:hypothetical protein
MPMTGSLNDILPEPISEQNEQVILEHLKAKLRTALSLSVDMLHAMERRFGPEAREVVRAMARYEGVSPRENPGDAYSDLHAFCDQLERGCTGTHRWQRVVDEPGCVGYHFTRCMWAEVFCELGEPELGWIACASDEPGVRSFNPDLRFERTKVLMHGDELCDHVFYVAGARAEEPTA